MGVGSILGLIKLVLQFILKIPEWIAFWKRKKLVGEIEDKTDAMKEAVKEAETAQTIEEKANAACKIEKLLNPNSTCDSNDGKH